MKVNNTSRVSFRLIRKLRNGETPKTGRRMLRKR